MQEPKNKEKGKLREECKNGRKYSFQFEEICNSGYHMSDRCQWEASNI